MSELEIEDEIISYSDSLEFRNGQKIPIEMINGKPYLVGFKVDTNGNPSFSPLYNPEKGKDVLVDASSKIIDDLLVNIEETSSSQFPKNNQNKSFVSIVETIVDVWNKKFAKYKSPSFPLLQQIGVDPKTARKYLSIGAEAGLLDKSQVQQNGKFPHEVPITKKSKTRPEDDEYFSEFTEWFETDEVQQWFVNNSSARIDFKAKKVKVKDKQTGEMKEEFQGGFGNAGKLFKIMKIMQISPEDLASYGEGKDGLAKLKVRLQKKIWIDPRTKENFGSDKFEGRRWSVYEWATNPEAPDPDYKIIKGKYKGAPRKIKSAKTAHNTWYDFAGLIIQYAKEHGVGVPDQEAGTILSQIANKPKYAKIRLSVDQMESMKKCLQNGMNGHTPQIQNITVEITDYKTEKKAVIPEPNVFFDVDVSFWKDAYFYFLMSLEMGFRAEEAFTIIAEEVEEDSDNSGLIFFSEKGFPVSYEEYQKGNPIQVQIYTRKSEKPDQAGQGTRIHAGFIQSPECKDLIIERYEEIKKGMKSNDPAKFGVVKTFKDAPYTEHALIGADGRYVQLGTLNLPSSASYQSEEDIKQFGKSGIVEPREKERAKLRGMMKHCYSFVGLKHPYWFERSLHSLRHVFAQYWLTLSDYNYGFVAIVGHWKTESIVREVYGEQRGGDINRLQRVFSTGKDGDKTPFEILREKEKAEMNITAQEQKRSAMMHPDIEARLQADREIIDKIFNEGGEYGGKTWKAGEIAYKDSIVKERDADGKIIEGSA